MNTNGVLGRSPADLFLKQINKTYTTSLFGALKSNQNQYQSAVTLNSFWLFVLAWLLIGQFGRKSVML